MKIKFRLKRALITLLTIISIVGLPTLPALAAGADISTVGPQGVVGASGLIGPQGTVGASGTIGSTGAVGPGSSTTASNSNTGPNSTNSNSSTTNTDATVTATNSSTTNNTADLNINSGNNTIDANTTVGTVKTGSIAGSINILNVGNSTLDPGSSASSQIFDSSGLSLLNTNNTGGRVDISNGGTGPNSTNNNSVVGNNVIRVQDTNTALANNNLTITANSGRNSILGNSKVAGLNTGDINLATNVFNLLNASPSLLLTVDFWTLLGNYSGDILVDNSLTGPNSTNTNNANLNNSSTVNVTNTGTANNTFTFDTNTGNNSVGGNTSIGNITTGTNEVQSSTTNLVNPVTPLLYLINVFGEWSGVLDGVDPSNIIINAANTVTGPYTDNLNNVNVNNSSDVNITNTATANNNINIAANTGENTVTGNTIVGNLATGSIRVATNVVNILNNLSRNASNIRLKIINIFGNWNGNVTNKVPCTSACTAVLPEISITPAPEVTPASQPTPIQPTPAAQEQPTVTFASVPEQPKKFLGAVSFAQPQHLPIVGADYIAPMQTQFPAAPVSAQKLPWVELGAAMAVTFIAGIGSRLLRLVRIKK